MIPVARCVHKTATRMRIRIPSRKGDRAFFKALEEQLSQCRQITGSEVNPLTGSVLIFHAGDLAAIADFAERRNIFRLEGTKNNPTSLMSATLSTYRNLDDRLKKLSGGEFDVPAAACVGLSGVGIYKIVRGTLAAPSWHTAFWYALNIFLWRLEFKRISNRGQNAAQK